MLRGVFCRLFYFGEFMKKVTEEQLKAMKEMGAAMYASQEAWDIANAAQALQFIASMCQDEIDEADDIQSLANIMRGLIEFINGEIVDLVSHARGATEKNAPAEVVSYETKTISASSESLNLSYVKSLGLAEYPDLAVKFVAKDEIKGYSILWGDASKVDLELEYFTKDTNFWNNQPQWLTWDHAQDEQFKSDPRIGNIVETGEDDWGKWYIAKLKKAEAYRKYLDMLIQGKKVGSSSDSAPQYVERVRTGKSIWLKTWPLFAVSLTDNPCEPRMIGSVDFLKSLVTDLPEVVHKEQWQNEQRTLEVLKLRYPNIGDF